MAKTKNLRGIPGNLANSYLSTTGYYGTFYGGYMADWLLKLFKETEAKSIKIDILNKKIYPSTRCDKALKSHLPILRKILEKELINNNFDKEFIVKAELNFERFAGNGVKCYPIMEDRNGKKYYAKKPIFSWSWSYETYSQSIFQKIKSWLKNLN